ncbi:MAG: acetyl-CoA carboxylase biotin carboxyl carrier protein subunit [Spirochaetota bacterium]|nr:acetyl-CoA carboxylase biotin carboxyl carrier protein subunit [Spirochaetota bacterium]
MSKMYKVKVEGNIYEVEVEFVSETAAFAPIQNQVPATSSAQPQSTTSSVSVTGKGIPIIAPMQGNIWKIVKNIGDTVKTGETILILEAMKMENNIIAPKDGTIVSLLVKEGQLVDSGSTLVELA